MRRPRQWCPVWSGRQAWSGLLCVPAFVGSVLWLGFVAGWPVWWRSLAVVALIASAGAGVVLARVRGRGSRARGRAALAAGLTAGFISGGVAAVAGVIALDTVTVIDSSAVDDATAEVSRSGGDIVCAIVTRGTDDARARAVDAATAELADRLRSGAGALATDTTTSTCTPVQTGVVSASRGSAEIVVSVDVTERDGADVVTVGRVLGGHLERVGGRWLASSLEVLR